MRAVALSAVALMVLALAGSSALAQPPPMEALPEILHLELSQHPAWRLYKDSAAVDRAESARQGEQAEELNALPTPARLDALLHQMQKQQAAFQRQAEATRAFYAVLSPEQRTIFDQVTRLPVRSPPQGYRPQQPRYNPPTSSLPVPPAYAPLPTPER
jgi:hypothetical protein